MGKQLQARAKELFDAARRAPAAERSALLARECAGDEPLRTVVEGWRRPESS